jgi:hypothetical protein
MGKLQLSRPFLGVGWVTVMSRGYISLPVTFGMAENFHTESVLFDVVEVSLPFNAILGRSALYQFMAVVHYGYLVLKMQSPMVSSRSGEIVMHKPMHWRSSSLRQQLVRPLLNLGARTLHRQACSSAARPHHHVCNPLSRRASP